MANKMYDLYFGEREKHEVGTLNTMWAKPYVNGAILEVENIDNYLLVELNGYDEEGNIKCKPLTANNKQGFLVATHEEESLFGDGTTLQGNYTDFYNAKGEIVRLMIPEPFVRFETSAFTKANTGKALKYGQNVHYDAATKKYIVSNDTSDHSGFASATNKYELVGIDTDFGQNVGKETIRLQAK